MSSRKKILVTGGAGYIGAHTVVQLFENNYLPVVVDDFSGSDKTLLHGVEKITGNPVLFYEGNCCDRAFIDDVFRQEANIEGIIHFAAYKSVGESVARPISYYRNNLDSLLTLLEAMGDHQIKNLIFSSSCTVYGQPDHIPVDETEPFKKAESPYGATKQMCEIILEDATAANENLKVISLRYFNPIGAHPSALIGELPIGKPNNLVPYITQVAAGRREKVIVFGGAYDTEDGTCIRDFIHIVDLADAHVKAMDQILRAESGPGYESYNLGTGTGVSVLKLIKDFIEITGTKLPFEIGDPRPGDVVQTYANPKKAADGLGWNAKYSHKDALLHAWEWEKRISNIKK